MNKLTVLFLFFAVLSANAAYHCEDLDKYVNEGYDIEHVKNTVYSYMKDDFSKQCFQATGSENIFFFTGEWVSTCEGLSGSVNGYIKAIVGCNFCE